MENIIQNKQIIIDIKEYIKDLLKPLENYFYHHYGHAIDVMQRSIYLGEKEGVNESELEILAIASLFHDSGFSVRYEKNERIGAKIAEKYLLKIGYPKDKIKKIKELIIATDPLYMKTKNILEKIIKDADLDNLGREDFFKKGKDLKRELEFIKKINIGKKDWQKNVMNLMHKHRYFTRTQMKERTSQKESNALFFEQSSFS